MPGKNMQVICLTAILLLVLNFQALFAAPMDKIEHNIRCKVCGMFVAKYDNWIVQAQLAGGDTFFFDGAKDMLVFYFNPQQYSSSQQKDIHEIWIKDYYTLKWLDAKKAFYVVGSDIYGPMGKEFIPFSSREAAENFLQDHHGEKIFIFDEITDDLVQSMRSGSTMRHGVK